MNPLFKGFAASLSCVSVQYMLDLQSSIIPQVLQNNAALWLFLFLFSFSVSWASRVFLKKIARALRTLGDREHRAWGAVLADLLDGLGLGALFGVTFALTSRLAGPPPLISKLLALILISILMIQALRWGMHLIYSWRVLILDKRAAEDPSSTAALGMLYTAARVALVTVLVLVGLSNFGINISALLAGLGVGGIAVALAAQNVLGDLLASLSIVLDKPFVVGDFIISGEMMGTVEHIGVKTTRLRSLSGEQIIISNKDLLESRVRNFKRMTNRRVVQSFGVTYSTPVNLLEQIPSWASQVVGSFSNLKFERCHLRTFGTSSLDFEMVFYVNDPDYNLFMDLQQNVLLMLFKKFSVEGVNFAFPTQSIYLEK